MKQYSRLLIPLALLFVVMPHSGGYASAQSESQVDYDVDDDGLIEISNLEQLDAVRHDLSGDGIPDSRGGRDAYGLAFSNPATWLGCPDSGCMGYELTRNLDFGDHGSYASGSVDRGWTKREGGEGWLPIGTHADRFTTRFVGNGYSIANLYIDRAADYVGLFGEIDSRGSIRQLRLVKAEVRGLSRVGSLTGANDGTIVDSHASAIVLGTHRVGGLTGANGEPSGTIIDSSTSGTVKGTGAVGGVSGGNWGTISGSHSMSRMSGTNQVGGLAGWNVGPIRNCYATGSVSGTEIGIGGLIGHNSRMTIVSSFATGDVSGGLRVGGLVGENSGIVGGSYATGSVSGSSSVGGLVGFNFADSFIISSYATGDVFGGSRAGGLAGHNGDGSLIIGSYSIGAVSGTSDVGGLSGWNSRPNGISTSYWNVETSGRANGVGGGVGSGAEGKTTAELQSPSGYSGVYSNWNTDFDNADGDNYEFTGVDEPWDFGPEDRYPALRADFDGDGDATWLEFGMQHAVATPSEDEETERPSEEVIPSVDALGSCTNGVVVAEPEENLGLVEDCEILLQSVDTLAGTGFLIWDSDRAIDRWQGITVEGNPPRVVKISLSGSDLSGRIPAQLGELSALEVLNLRVNELTGGIPSELSSLSELRVLDLHGNTRLGGAIPPELGNLTNLESLVLDATGVSGSIPPGLGNLLDLEQLFLGQNSLSGSIPPQLGNLRKLRSLSLRRNELTGQIPAELGQLIELKTLELGTNNLTGDIPPDLGQLVNLQSLTIEENRLTGPLPRELANLSNLRQFALGDNQFSGEVPTWLSGMSRLGTLRLHKNQFSGSIPPSLGDLPQLDLLYLHENQLTGVIPVALGKLYGLSDLVLDDNQLTGPIPGELANLTTLKTMSLSHNNLTGEVPRAFGNLYDLQFLMLNDNRLTGSIPSEIGLLSQLEYLHLNNNQLTGTIPFELAALSRLKEMKVAGNGLTGCVPWQLSRRLNLDIRHEACDLIVIQGQTVSIDASLIVGDDSMKVIAVGDAANGTVTLEGTTIIYRHDGSETTADSFICTITDQTNVNVVTVGVTVVPANVPPVAGGDYAEVQEGATLSLDSTVLLDNDTDAENDPLTITAVGGAVNGEVSLDGSIIYYRHDGSETMAGSFSYTVSDGTDAATAEVSISVTPVNDQPVPAKDTFSVDEGDTLRIEAQTLLENDTDAEGDTITVVTVGEATNGQVSLDGSTIYYMHDGSETKSDSFSYTVSDGVDLATVDVMIAITPVDDEVASLAGSEAETEAPADRETTEIPTATRVALQPPSDNAESSNVLAFLTIAVAVMAIAGVGSTILLLSRRQARTDSEGTDR